MISKTYDRMSDRQDKWKEKIKSDLKGRSPEELTYQLSETLSVDPFLGLGDASQIATRAHADHTQSWKTAVAYSAEDLLANKDLLAEAKSKGVDLVFMDMIANVGAEEVSRILSDVRLYDLSIYCVMDRDIARWSSVAESEGIDIKFLHKNAKTWNDVGTPRKNGLLLIQEEVDEIDSQLCQLLASAVESVKEIEAIGSGLKQVFANSVIRLTLSPKILLEISRLRALSILWANMSQALIGEAIRPHIQAKIEFSQDSTEPEQNMIEATLKSASAIIGGCQSIIIDSLDQYTDRKIKNEEALRLNVLNILSLESQLDMVSDPVFGSPTIGDMTGKIVDRVWQELMLKI